MSRRTNLSSSIQIHNNTRTHLDSGCHRAVAPQQNLYGVFWSKGRPPWGNFVHFYPEYGQHSHVQSARFWSKNPLNWVLFNKSAPKWHLVAAWNILLSYFMCPQEMPEISINSWKAHRRHQRRSPYFVAWNGLWEQHKRHILPHLFWASWKVEGQGRRFKQGKTNVERMNE